MPAPSKPEEHRLLIVEDNDDISELLVIRLGLAGYTTFVARNVDQAQSALFTFRPTGVLLDIGLPDGSGFDVLQVVKTVAKTRDIPVLMLTARQAMTDIRKALDMGAADYVTKPFDDQKLLQRVAKLLGLPMPVIRTERSMLNRYVPRR